jgi:hypothetical protein
MKSIVQFRAWEKVCVRVLAVRVPAAGAVAVGDVVVRDLLAKDGPRDSARAREVRDKVTASAPWMTAAAPLR